jgi:hypothetical protein
MEEIVGFWEDETITKKTKTEMARKINGDKGNLEIIFPIKLTLLDFGAIIEALMSFRNKYLDGIIDEIIRQFAREENNKMLIPVAVYAPYIVSKMDREKRLEDWKKIWEISEDEYDIEDGYSSYESFFERSPFSFLF